MTLNSQMRRCLPVLAAASALLLCRASSGAASPADLADAILKSADARNGLCVHVGCGDGTLTAALAQRGQYLVHGLATDDKTLKKARRHILSLKSYGVVSVDSSPLAKLPYADDLANLIVVHDLPAVLAAGGSAQEIIRVLAPRGVGFLGVSENAGGRLSEGRLKKFLDAAGIDGYQIARETGLWARIVKPVPEGIDEWTHLKHGPDRNAVSRDTLALPPNSLRWVYGPRWRAHGGIHLSAHGRNVYANGMVRDAFNGLPLFSVSDRRKFKYATAMLADRERIYVIAPRGPKCLVALDASTGKQVMAYEEIRMPLRAGVVRVGSDLIFANGEGVGSVAVNTGKLNWKNEKLKGITAPGKGQSILAVGDGRVFVQVSRSKKSAEPNKIACLSMAAGKILWAKAGPDVQGELLFCQYGVVVCRDSYRTYPKKIYVRSGEDGRLLWTSGPLNVPKTLGVFGIGGLIWVDVMERTIGLDPATGQVKREIEVSAATMKCAEPAATTRYIAGRNFWFVDLELGEVLKTYFDRNGCGADPGLLFCNGLSYSYPKQCSCFSMIRGYTAFASDSSLATGESSGGQPKRLQLGPAYGEEPAGTTNSSPDDADASWPAFRHDAQRSAATKAPVPLPLETLWEVEPEEQACPEWLSNDWRNNPQTGAAVSPPVVARGLIIVALPNSHRVCALDAESGEIRWLYAAGGRVLAPPTIHGDLCLFGSQDGYAYCLRLADGSLVWRFRAAPMERDILAFGQVESLWAVAGGVLVRDGVAFFAAGRSTGLVGGMAGYAVEARTGKLIWRATPPTGYEYTRENKIAPVYVGDLSVAGENVVQLAHPRWIVDAGTGQFAESVVPVKHRFVRPKPVAILAGTRDGLMDCSRTRHQGPTDLGHGYNAQEFGPVSAQHIAFCEDRIFGYQLPKIKTFYYDNEASRQENPLRLVAWDRAGAEVWSKSLPDGTEFYAMILADNTLFASGVRRGKEKRSLHGMLWAFAAHDGAELMATELGALPASEGLAAASGKLYLTLQDGRLVCLGRK